MRVETIRVSRTFASFDEFWAIAKGGPSAGQALRAMEEASLRSLRDEMADVVKRDEGGWVEMEGWANAVVGVV